MVQAVASPIVATATDRMTTLKMLPPPPLPREDQNHVHQGRLPRPPRRHRPRPRAWRP